MTRESERFLQTSHVLIDSGLLMSLVYASSRLGHGYFTENEWQLYEVYYNLITQTLRSPDIVIYLAAPVDFLRQRIIERGREFEIKHHSVEYLAGLAEGLNYVEGKLTQSQVPILKYQVDMPTFSIEKVKRELIERLEH